MTVSTGREFKGERHYSMPTWIVVVVIAIVGVVFSWVIGLVSIPVQLHIATKDEHIAFNLLHDKCGSRVQNRYYCPVCNEPVEKRRLKKFLYPRPESLTFYICIQSSS